MLTFFLCFMVCMVLHSRLATQLLSWLRLMVAVLEVWGETMAEVVTVVVVVVRIIEPGQAHLPIFYSLCCGGGGKGAAPVCMGSHINTFGSACFSWPSPKIDAHANGRECTPPPPPS